MRYSPLLKIGLIGILAAYACGKDVAQGTNSDIDGRQAKGSAAIVQSAGSLSTGSSLLDPQQNESSSSSFPQLSELQEMVSASPIRNMDELLAMAQRGYDFHSSVTLFVSNSTRQVSNELGYQFENGDAVMPFVIERLSCTPLAGNQVYNDNCIPADDLYQIMKRAERKGHLDGTADVVGYLNRVSRLTETVFWMFRNSLRYNPHNDDPKEMLAWHNTDFIRVENLTRRGKIAFGSLPEEIQDDLARWITQYGEARIHITGKDVLRGYGLIEGN